MSQMERKDIEGMKITRDIGVNMIRGHGWAHRKARILVNDAGEAAVFTQMGAPVARFRMTGGGRAGVDADGNTVTFTPPVSCTSCNGFRLTKAMAPTKKLAAHWTRVLNAEAEQAKEPATSDG